MRACTKCGQDKHEDGFYADHPTKGKFAQCKDCYSAYARQYYRDHKAHCRSRKLQWGASGDNARLASKRSREKYRGKRNAETLRWQKSHPEKFRAQAVVHRMLNRGELVKPAQCSQAGDTSVLHTDRIVAHHPDYSKPNEVVWLCQRCHTRLHISLGT